MGLLPLHALSLPNAAGRAALEMCACAAAVGPWQSGELAVCRQHRSVGASKQHPVMRRAAGVHLIAMSAFQDPIWPQ